jgi:hypothetical protein
MSVKRSATWVGAAAARSGGVQRRPLREAEQVNQARRACGSKVVSYQQAQSAPVVESAVAAGKSCCVRPESGGFTWARDSGRSPLSNAATWTSVVPFAPTSS